MINITDKKLERVANDDDMLTVAEVRWIAAELWRLRKAQGPKLFPPIIVAERGAIKSEDIEALKGVGYLVVEKAQDRKVEVIR